MPIIQSNYRAPFGFGSGHLQSIYPVLFRRVPRVTTVRERLELPDGDFLDLDMERRRGSRTARGDLPRFGRQLLPALRAGDRCGPPTSRLGRSGHGISAAAAASRIAYPAPITAGQPTICARSSRRPWSRRDTKKWP